MKKILVLLFTIITILPTFAAHWMQIGEKRYLDIDSIENYVNEYGNKEYSQYVYWTKNLNNGSNFYEEEKIYKRKIWFVKYKLIIDIDKKKITAKESAFFDLKGNLIDYITYTDSELRWLSIIPDTSADLDYKIIRYTEKKGKTPLYDILRKKSKKI